MMMSGMVLMTTAATPSSTTDDEKPVIIESAPPSSSSASSSLPIDPQAALDALNDITTSPPSSTDIITSGGIRVLGQRARLIDRVMAWMLDAIATGTVVAGLRFGLRKSVV